MCKKCFHPKKSGNEDFFGETNEIQERWRLKKVVIWVLGIY